MLVGRTRSLPFAPVESGEVLLPGYRVVRLLAHGKRLDTYDAWDEDRDCRVVVKVLRADRRHERDVVASVLQEGRLVTTLAHPHLVRGFEVVEQPLPAVVLETLTGATLGALVEEQPIGAADVTQLGLQLVSVLGYLHRRDWLHLDLKPGNVVVQDGRAVLIDLSLAGRPGTGRSGAGTPGYLAPEQAVGRGLSPATDVFGLGVTLSECLSGELPYGEEATWESRRRLPLVHRPHPREPVALPTDVPPELAGALRACVALDPAERPSLARLRSVLGDLAGA
ncbi:serine/threonine-protein kinase [Nocardioides euryhalodurans]|uniref:Serine/threonine protein kinase n=1 Tax=Nocardioides euryhalodurans TaxID=2518370 RepID=A0A4V1BE06_9ACTN|nr:serine/threonine-protein kinase [Nocardioides euryhalodurans]QBR92952.1 serine/threonine protein kinase [Nocardioides euryhalodurans]